MKKRATKRPPPKPPALMDSKELCVRLACIAAFHLTDPQAQKTIYTAIRQLQLLDAEAVKAGILRTPT